MRCPFCASLEDKVIDTRAAKEAREIRRRRECLSCQRRYTTYERALDALPLVIKNDGSREPFDRNKIERGLQSAATKRPVSLQQIAELAERVEAEMTELAVREVKASAIGSRVLPKLRLLDEVAYVRYASVYRDFRDIDEFVRELDELQQPESDAVTGRRELN